MKKDLIKIFLGVGSERRGKPGECIVPADKVNTCFKEKTCDYLCEIVKGRVNENIIYHWP